MRMPGFRPRLLPATLAVMALVLSLKLASLWLEVTDFAPPPMIAEAVAEEAKTDPAAAPEPSASPAAPILPGDPLPLSQAEIDLLQKLSARREALDLRERELDMREGLLRAAEQQLEAKVAAKAAELDKLQEKLEGAARQHDAEQEKKIAGLVSIYEKMKPKDAARIFNELDMEILVDLLGRMRDAKTAPILAAMEEEKARAVTARLAERHGRIGMPS